MTSPIPEPNFMEDNNSYHGAISGDEAIKRLKKAIGNAYLTRFSTRHGRYILTVLKWESAPIIGNFKLTIRRNSRRKYSVEGMMKHFNSMDGLLGYYENNRIHPIFDNIGGKLTVQNYIYIQQKRCRIL